MRLKTQQEEEKRAVEMQDGSNQYSTIHIPKVAYLALPNAPTKYPVESQILTNDMG